MVAAVAAADLRPKEIQAKWDQEKSFILSAKEDALAE